jgi:hypothetical protein
MAVTHRHVSLWCTKWCRFSQWVRRYKSIMYVANMLKDISIMITPFRHVSTTIWIMHINMIRWYRHDNMRSIYHIGIICLRSGQIICVSYLWIGIEGWHDDVVVVDPHPIMGHGRRRSIPGGVTKMCWHTFQLKREHRNTSERVPCEPRHGSPIQFELDRSGAWSEVSRKIRVSDFPNWMVQFWQIQPLPTACIGDRDRANLHPSGIWAREGKDRG